MRLAATLLLVTCACRSDVSQGSRTIRVLAYAGDVPVPGVTVATSAPDGSIVDQASTDAVGLVRIGADPDSLVNVLFGTTSMITTVAADETLVHGPAADPPSLVAGVLELDAPPVAAADYTIDLGCITLHRPSLPASFNVATCNLGRDTDLDMLVRASGSVAATRVAFSTGSAQVTLPAWQTSGPSPTLTLDGVSPTVAWTLYADGLPFIDEPLTSSSFAPDGLLVDTTRVRATQGSAVTDLYVAGVPTAITFAASDFLPALAPPTRSGLTYGWEAASSIDATTLHVDFPELAWEVVLPPDMTGVRVPDIVTVSEPTSFTLRAVDSDALVGFDALVAAGIWSGDIVPLPSSGRVRTVTSTE